MFPRSETCIKKYSYSTPVIWFSLPLYTHGAFTAYVKQQDEITVERLEPNTEDLRIFSSLSLISTTDTGTSGKILYFSVLSSPPVELI